MKKFINVMIVLILSIFLFSCKKELKTEEEFMQALESIEFDFDLNNIRGGEKLPLKTKKYSQDILWELLPISDKGDNYVNSCASLNILDGVTSIVNKIDYDDDIDSTLYGKAMLAAKLLSSDGVIYTKEFNITVYEKAPDLNYSINKIKDYCKLDNPKYIETEVEIVWIKECKDDYYNLIVSDGTDYIFVDAAYYHKLYNLKVGDKVKVKGFSGKYGIFPIITSRDDLGVSVELISKGSKTINYQEIVFNDFSKMKDTDTSVYLNFVKFEGTIKAYNDAGGYAYYIEGKNNENIINISNCSFIHNNIGSDKDAKKIIDNNLGKVINIKGAIFINTDGKWEFIIIPSELK